MPNRETLEEFIVNFLWYNILHSTCNYALAPDFIPISSPKLYEAEPDSNKELSPNQIFFNGEDAAVSQIFKLTLEEGVFVESAFNMQCHIVQNALIHTAFSAILSAG